MITRRDFLKVTGVAAAAAALTACGGSSSTASSAASSTVASSEAASAVAKLDKVKVAVPNDTTNEARALTLLEKNGFFKLKADAGLTATKNDIEENPLNVLWTPLSPQRVKGCSPLTIPKMRSRLLRSPTSCRTRTTLSSTPTTPSPLVWTP